MTTPLKAIAFDADAVTLASLRAGLPGWEVEAVEGATAATLREDWSRGAADLFIVKAGDHPEKTVALCKFLASCRAVHPVGAAAGGDSLERRQRRRDAEAANQTPLLVLVPVGDGALVRAVLKAGAASCLVLPIDATELTRMLARAKRGNQPGRHTLDLDRAQIEDRWRDDGGQG